MRLVTGSTLLLLLLLFTGTVEPQFNEPPYNEVPDITNAPEEQKSPMVPPPTPDSTETIERMTCHCFLPPIRTDLTSSSYTTGTIFFAPVTQGPEEFRVKNRINELLI